MILAVCLVFLLFASDASCQTVVTYSSKPYEELLCPIADQTLVATWRDVTIGTNMASYLKGESDIEIVTSDPKHKNFMYSANTTTFRLSIQTVEDEDGGDYLCTTSGGGGSEDDYTIVVEVIPGTFSLDCFVPPDVTCPVQGVNPTSELVCTCAANGVRPGTLYLDITDAHTAQQNESIENGDLFNLRLKARVPVTESITEVTCSVKGYNTSEPIPSELITTTFMISPPTCSLDISFDRECKVATLTCSCTASPTDGEPPSDQGMVYSYFNGTGHMIASETTTTVQTNDVAAGAVNTYSCRGCNGLYYGDTSYVTQSSECTITTESTTEEPKPTPTKKQDPDFPKWVIILIIVVVLAVVIAVIAVIMYKKGKCGSNSSSDKLDDNGAGPRGDPEIPAYGVVDKNRTKDPTPAPRSSMRDSKNPSNPKQDGLMEMQYADLDHGNKPPSDEVRKPKEEPTEYATVQSVIV